MNLNNLNSIFKEKDSMELLEWAISKFHPKIALSSAFGPESIVLIHMLFQIKPDFKIFSIDTGRLPEETYECAEEILNRFPIQIEWYFPNFKKVEQLEKEKGLFSFRKGVENRLECCSIRKVEPLNRALKNLDAWITGIRKGQGSTREKLSLIEKDYSHKEIYKINPLLNWNSKKVWDYIKKYNLPFNRLHGKGYTSIGCAPCTRPILKGESERAGRWWWEKEQHKECGLHLPKKRLNKTLK